MLKKGENPFAHARLIVANTCLQAFTEPRP